MSSFLHIYHSFLRIPLHIFIHVMLSFFSFLFLIITIALKGDVLTASTVGLHLFYFFLTRDQYRVSKRKTTPLFSRILYYRLARLSVIALICYVAFVLRTALGEPWILFDLSLWIAIISSR